jgi:predicted O-methyltransferase YrrM
MIEDKIKYVTKKWRISRIHYPYAAKYTRTRKDMYNIFNDFGYKTGVEIGVFKGQNAEEMLKRIKGLKLYCVDPWPGRFAKYYPLAEKRLSKYKNAKIVYSASMDAVKKFEDNFFDFVYIDNAYHIFDDVMMDLICWVPKVKKGGAVAGHDYVAHCGVPTAVTAYTGAHGIRPVFITKESGSTNNGFFWVKQ